MLTKQQLQIIANMSDSFAKVNEQFNTSKSFNLINADELHMLNRKKREFEENAKIAKENWEKMANAEALRIIELLEEDLPFASITKMCKETGHYDSPVVMISRNGNFRHHEYYVRIEIVKKETRIEDEFGNYDFIPTGFQYSPTYNYKFDSVEELCSSDYFTREIRSKVL